MAFRSLAFLSFLFVGATAHPVTPEADTRALTALAAVNAALTEHVMSVVNGVPVLK